MKQKKISAVFFSLFFIYILGGGPLMSSEIQKQTSTARYFSSPEEAVPIITALLVKKAFKTLASYYDLSDSGINLIQLESGDFFIRKERPEVAHPTDIWQYKHPFSPGFKFSGMRSEERENVYLIHLEIIIDQGVDSPSQVGFDSFYMIKSDRGWQVLPDHVQADDPLKFPSEAPDVMPDLKLE
jgi:hypothetical protein